MTDKLKQNQVNVADLLPVKMLLDEHVSPKSVTNVFAAQEIPVEIIGVTGAHIPFHKFSGLYEQAARLLGDVNFGVSSGAVWGYELLGPYGEYATAAPDLRQCLLRLISAIHMYESGTFATLTRHGELTRFSYCINKGHPVGQYHVSAGSLGVMLDVIRYYMGKDWLPVRIETDTPESQSLRFLEEYYGVPVKGEQTGIGLIFPTKDLDTPNPNPGTKFSGYTLRDLGLLMVEEPPRTLIDAVVQVVRLRLLAGFVDLDGAARQLGLGTKVLQRRLAIEGESYRSILKRERHIHAIDLLTEKNHSISEIAKKLGYEYPGDFSRAFAKVEGIAPRAFRQPRQQARNSTQN